MACNHGENGILVSKMTIPCMASIVRFNLFNLVYLYCFCRPAFAWPLFVRLVENLDITGTFKLRKFNLQKEGFDPSVISDKLFFLHPKTGTYEILNVELFNSIITGAIRL